MSEHVGFTSRETGIIERATVAAREQGRQEMRVEFLAAIKEEERWARNNYGPWVRTYIKPTLDRLTARFKEGK